MRFLPLLVSCCFVGCGPPVITGATATSDATVETDSTATTPVKPPPTLSPPVDNAARVDRMKPAALEARLGCTPGSGCKPFIDDALDWAIVRQARLDLHRRRYRAAAGWLRRGMTEISPESPAHAAIVATMERLRERRAFKANRVGVLLPLSGPYANIGKTVRTAIKLAAPTVPKIQFIFRDTHGDADKAREATRRLILKDNVAALLGPIGQLESRGAAEIAERFEVPIMAFSAEATFTTQGTFVFRHRLTRQRQAQTIALYAIKQMGLKRFAILYPDSDFGRAMMRSFWRTVERNGGEIRGAQRYPLRSSNFSKPIKALIGRDDLAGRKIDPHWKQLNRKRKDKAFHVPPNVDFEALFIADGGRRARLLLPFLSYWDIELKTSRTLDPMMFAGKYAGDPPQLVQILGGSGFNNQRFARRAGHEASNSVFVDGFSPLVPEAEDFVARWSKRAGRPPPSLAAHAYDAAQLLGEATLGKTSRAQIRRALLGIRDYEGVFGATRVSGSGEVLFGLQVLTIQPNLGVVPRGGESIQGTLN